MFFATLLHHSAPTCCSLILLSLHTYQNIKLLQLNPWVHQHSSRWFASNGFPFLKHCKGALDQVTFINFFMTQITGWTSCLCGICWLSIHLLLDLVRLARLGGPWLHLSAIARIPVGSWFMVFRELGNRLQKSSLRSTWALWRGSLVIFFSRVGLVMQNAAASLWQA